MRAMKLTAALFAVLLAAPALVAQNQTVRIHAATVLDGTGKTLKNATIVVQGSKITSIETGSAADADLRSRTIDDRPGHDRRPRPRRLALRQGRPLRRAPRLAGTRNSL